MRARCTAATCTDSTAHGTHRTVCGGISWPPVPQGVPRQRRYLATVRKGVPCRRRALQPWRRGLWTFHPGPLGGLAEHHAWRGLAASGSSTTHVLHSPTRVNRPIYYVIVI